MKRSTALLLCISACAGDAQVPMSVVEERLGDTVVTTSRGVLEPVQVDSIEVIWESDELGNPQTIALVGDLLAIGDRDRVHVVHLKEGRLRTIGRSGDGPGEFRSVAMVGALGGDTIGVFDVGLRRVSLFSPEGEFLGSRRATPSLPFVNPSRDGPPLVRVGSGLLWTHTENVHLDRPTRLGLVWHDLEGDSTAVLEVLDDLQYIRFEPGILGSREIFPSRAIVAVGQGGLIAEGNGRDYCVRIHRAFREEVRKICRERPAIPTGPRLRSPDFGVLEDDPQLEVLKPIWREQEAGSVLPHFDALRFGEGGELWVRTLHGELADVHPAIATRRPEFGPSYREWEVFDPDGRVSRLVRFPSAFDPRVMDGEEVFGFLTLDTGEVVIGRVLLGATQSDR